MVRFTLWRKNLLLEKKVSEQRTSGLSLTPQDLRALKAMFDWGPKNFHLLREDNKVKLWMKVYDKICADKIDVNISLAEAVKQARQRAIDHTI